MIIEFLKQVVDVVVIITPLLPLLVATTKYVAKQTRQKNLYLLADRAGIIVGALEKNIDQFTNPERKGIAVDKIVQYANEIGIRLTREQASDYIENAVLELNKQSGFASALEYNPEVK